MNNNELKQHIKAPIKQMIITFDVEILINSNNYLENICKQIASNYGLHASLLSQDDFFVNISFKNSSDTKIKDLDYLMVADKVFEKLSDYTPRIEIRTEEEATK